MHEKLSEVVLIYRKEDTLVQGIVFNLLCWNHQKKRLFFFGWGGGGGPCVHADNIVMNCVFLCKNLHLHQNPLMAWLAAPLMSCLGHISPIFQPILPLWLLIPAVKWTERNEGIGLVSVWFTFGSSASASSSFSFSSVSYSARGRVGNDSNLNLHPDFLNCLTFFFKCTLFLTHNNVLLRFCILVYKSMEDTHSCVFSLPT